jgi:serine/threonine protein kinase
LYYKFFPYGYKNGCPIKISSCLKISGLPFFDRINSRAKDLLACMLQKDPLNRWTAEELLDLPIFL